MVSFLSDAILLPVLLTTLGKSSLQQRLFPLFFRSSGCIRGLHCVQSGRLVTNAFPVVFRTRHAVTPITNCFTLLFLRINLPLFYFLSDAGPFFFPRLYKTHGSNRFLPLHDFTQTQPGLQRLRLSTLRKSSLASQPSSSRHVIYSSSQFSAFRQRCRCYAVLSRSFDTKPFPLFHHAAWCASSAGSSACHGGKTCVTISSPPNSVRAFLFGGGQGAEYIQRPSRALRYVLA